MKHLWLIGSTLMLLFSGCSSIDKEISRNEVMLDSKTNTWKFNKNGREVTGTIIADTLLNGDSCTMIVIAQKGLTQSHRIQSIDKLYEEASYANGLLQGELKKYYPSGLVSYSASYANGKLNGDVKEFYPDNTIKYSASYLNGNLDGMVKVFHPDSTLKYSASYKNGKLDGPYTQYSNNVCNFETFYKNGKKEGYAFYSQNGKLLRIGRYVYDKKHGTETVYDEQSGNKIRENIYEYDKLIGSYDLDEYGERIIFKLLDYKTGFFLKVNYDYNQALYEARVILKWKNVSNYPLKEKITIKAEFFNDEDEEWGEETVYLVNPDKKPLQPGKTRQVYLDSTVGYTNFLGTMTGKVSCNIYINGRLYKTVKIANQILDGNMI